MSVITEIQSRVQASQRRAGRRQYVRSLLSSESAVQQSPDRVLLRSCVEYENRLRASGKASVARSLRFLRNRCITSGCSVESIRELKVFLSVRRHRDQLPAASVYISRSSRGLGPRGTRTSGLAIRVVRNSVTHKPDVVRRKVSGVYASRLEASVVKSPADLTIKGPTGNLSNTPIVTRLYHAPVSVISIADHQRVAREYLPFLFGIQKVY